MIIEKDNFTESLLEMSGYLETISDSDSFRVLTLLKFNKDQKGHLYIGETAFEREMISIKIQTLPFNYYPNTFPS